jgi:hypothetical protein
MEEKKTLNPNPLPSFKIWTLNIKVFKIRM